MFREMGVPVIGMISNMDGFSCPSCGHTSEVFNTSEQSVAEVAHEFKVPFLGKIPLVVGMSPIDYDASQLMLRVLRNMDEPVIIGPSEDDETIRSRLVNFALSKVL